jgi:hypothetical protein
MFMLLDPANMLVSEVLHVLLVYQVCSRTDNNFVVINQKGIDPPSLDLLARAGVSHGTIIFCSLVIEFEQ